MTLEKSKDNVSVICSKDGHFDGASVLSSTFQDMTFGNILIGGFVGLGVDAASGAMNEYPDSVMVVLTPKEFPDDQALNEFFDRQADRINAKADEAIAVARNKPCGDAPYDTPAQESVYGWGACPEAALEDIIKGINAEREAQLETLQTRRAEAKVGSQ